jgi:polar amino acid transport system permease protein
VGDQGTSHTRGESKGGDSRARDGVDVACGEGSDRRARVGVPLVAGGLLLCPPLGAAAAVSYARYRRLRGVDDLESQTYELKARNRSLIAIGIGSSLLVVLLVVAVFTLNDFAVARSYLNGRVIAEVLPQMTGAFLRLNVLLAVVSEMVIIPWSIMIALARSSKSVAAAPMRVMATAYGDLFRGIPGLLTLLIVGYGIPRSGIPILSEISPFWSMVVALTLLYGAYTSEVVRSGIRSVPFGQILAARAIGLTPFRAQFHVVLPQAVRTVTPALLAWFVSLIKDTSLVSVLGLLDAVNVSRIGVVNKLSLAPLTAAALLFLIATIPLTRLTDYLLARSEAKTRTQL